MVGQFAFEGMREACDLLRLRARQRVILSEIRLAPKRKTDAVEESLYRAVLSSDVCPRA